MNDDECIALILSGLHGNVRIIAGVCRVSGSSWSRWLLRPLFGMKNEMILDWRPIPPRKNTPIQSCRTTRQSHHQDLLDPNDTILPIKVCCHLATGHRASLRRLIDTWPPVKAALRRRKCHLTARFWITFTLLFPATFKHNVTPFQCHEELDGYYDDVDLISKKCKINLVSKLQINNWLNISHIFIIIFRLLTIFSCCVTKRWRDRSRPPVAMVTIHQSWFQIRLVAFIGCSKICFISTFLSLS